MVEHFYSNPQQNPFASKDISLDMISLEWLKMFGFETGIEM
jgi:hypothetical protein